MSEQEQPWWVTQGPDGKPKPPKEITPQENPYKTYSCRFEFSQDYSEFLYQAGIKGVKVSTNKFVTDSDRLPDVFVEFITEAELEQVRDVMRAGLDLHVGLQSLKQLLLSENTCDRDYDIR